MDPASYSNSDEEEEEGEESEDDVDSELPNDNDNDNDFGNDEIEQMFKELPYQHDIDSLVDPSIDDGDDLAEIQAKAVRSRDNCLKLREEIQTLRGVIDNQRRQASEKIIELKPALIHRTSECSTLESVIRAISGGSASTSAPAASTSGHVPYNSTRPMQLLLIYLFNNAWRSLTSASTCATQRLSLVV